MLWYLFLKKISRMLLKSGFYFCFSGCHCICCKDIVNVATIKIQGILMFSICHFLVYGGTVEKAQCKITIPFMFQIE